METHKHGKRNIVPNNPFEGDVAKQIQSLYENIGINDQAISSEINKTMNVIEASVPSWSECHIKSSQTEDHTLPAPFHLH